MPPSTSTYTTDQLLDHAGWLRRLAQHLVRDGAQAEDAVQEVWLAARRSPPEKDRQPRPWLAEVLRNVLRMAARTERRRLRWETEAAALHGDRSVPGADQVHQRVEAHQRLVEAVMRLPAPLRTTVLLRYFEDRSAAEIARMTGTPAGTVRWRLKEALDRLRAALDDEEKGDRRRWAVAMAPLAWDGTEWPRAAGWLRGPLRTPVRPAALLGAALAAATGLWLLVGTSARTPAPDQPRVSQASPMWSGWDTPPLPPEELAGLEGRVVTNEGGGQAGAWVAAFAMDGSDTSAKRRKPIAEAQTDMGGGFDLKGLAPGKYKVVAAAAGHLPVTREGVEVAAGETARIELRMKPGGLLLSGRVEDAGGGTVAGAIVSAAVTVPQGGGSQRPFVLRTVTDPDGRYRLFTQAGIHTLRVEAAGYAPAESWIGLRDARTFDFQLIPAATVAGVVRERRTHRPVPGAEVLLLPQESFGRKTPEAEPLVTDEEGRFLSSSVGPGRYVLSARKGALVAGDTELTVGAAHRREDVLLLVDPAPGVSGRVVDAAGRPAPRTLIRLSQEGGPARHPGLGTRADELGHFRIEGVRPGFYRALAMNDPAPAFLTPASETVRVVGETRDVVLKVPATARIEGQVLTSAGDAAETARAVLLLSARRGSTRWEAALDLTVEEGGHFRTDVLPGQVKLQASDGGTATVEDLGAVEAGKTYRTSLRLGEPGRAAVAGQVLRHDGSPAEGVVVRAAGAQTRTDAQGRFHLVGLGAGKTAVTALNDEDRPGDPAHAPIEVELGPEERREGLSLTLAPRGRISGRILAPDGTALEGVAVTASEEERDGRIDLGRSYRVASGPDGAFVIDGLSDHAHSVWAIHEDYPDASVKGARIGTDSVVLRFRPGASVEGVVVDGEGKPLPDFLLSVVASQPRPELRVPPSQHVHDPAGRFRVRRLAPGAYRFQVGTARGQSAEALVTLDEGEARSDLRLVAAPEVTLTGRVLSFADGTALPTAHGSLSHGRNARLPLQADAAGVITAPGVPRGTRLYLSLEAPGFIPDSFVLSVPSEGDPEPLAIRLVPGAEDVRPSVAGLDLESDGKNVVVRGVRADSPAARAHVTVGDRLIARRPRRPGFGRAGRAPGAPFGPDELDGPSVEEA